MNGQIDDKAFEEYLKRGSPVSQQYRALESDEVPPDFDSRILAQAEEAVRSRQERKTRTWQRWSVPVALAASTVLAISIVIESGQHESTLARAPSYSDPARDVPTASRQMEERKSESSVESQDLKPVAAPSAADERARSGAASREREAQAAREQMERRSAARTVVLPPSPEVLAKRAEPEMEGDLAAHARAQNARESSGDEPADQTAQTAPPAAAPVPAGPVSRSDVQRSSSTTRFERPGLTSQGQVVDARSNPEDWLREIRELRAAGKTEEADREWQAFRERFPDHVVAEDDTAIGQ